MDRAGFRARWKRFETKVAESLGGKRIPITGRESVDVWHEVFAIECKYRESLPAWLHKAHKQASDGAKPGQLPIVALGEKGGKDYIVLALKDFSEWYGGPNP